MVLMNGSTRARHISSIINQNQGGGSKKAGLPPTVGFTQAIQVAYRNRNYPQSRSTMILTANPKVRQSAPIGRVMNLDYWKIPGL